MVPLLVSLVTAVVLWGAFKAFGWETTYHAGARRDDARLLPGVLGALLLVPIVARQDRVDPSGIGDLLRSNLGFLVSRDNKALHSLLASVDLFSFWTLALFDDRVRRRGADPEGAGGGPDSLPLGGLCTWKGGGFGDLLRRGAPSPAQPLVAFVV